MVSTPCQKERRCPIGSFGWSSSAFHSKAATDHPEGPGGHANSPMLPMLKEPNDLETSLVAAAICCATYDAGKNFEAVSHIPPDAFNGSFLGAVWAVLLEYKGRADLTILAARFPNEAGHLADIFDAGNAANLTAYGEAVLRQSEERKARDLLRAKFAEMKDGRPALEVMAELQVAPVATTAKVHRLKPMPLPDLLSRSFPARGKILSPWLPRSGLAMIYGPRGLGKTWVSTHAAWAAATGGSFLKWSASRAHEVLFIDGEMPACDLQERFAAVAREHAEVTIPENLHLLSSSLEADGLPDLASVHGQTVLDAALGSAELVVLDNISTLLRSGRENEADDFGGFQSWLLAKRREGRTVLLIHHAGKGGQQRGTSRREDALDTVIALKRPADYEPSQGARFEVHFEKNRDFSGPDAAPFEASLSADGGWRIRDLEDEHFDRVARMKREGMSQRDIATETGLSLSKVNRILKQGEIERHLSSVSAFQPLGMKQ